MTALGQKADCPHHRVDSKTGFAIVLWERAWVRRTRITSSSTRLRRRAPPARGGVVGCRAAAGPRDLRHGERKAPYAAVHAQSERCHGPDDLARRLMANDHGHAT